MEQKSRSRGIPATCEGIEKLEARRIEKGWSYDKLTTEAKLSRDTVDRVIARESVEKESIRKIAIALNLQPTDIVAAEDWNRLPRKSKRKQTSPIATVTESPSTIDIPWREVCRAMLNTQNELTTNPLTRNDGIEFERDEIYVPLGLVERPKREKRRDDVSPEKGSQLYEPTEEEIKIVGKYELDAVCEQLLKQGDGQDQSQGRSIAAIIGEPGAGKSTLQQKIADWVFHNTEADVPILVSLGAIGNKSLNQYLMEDWLQNAAQELDAAPPEWKQAFGQLLKSGGVWLLLDGADEMAVDSPLGQIAAQLREGWAQNLRLVLTCRLNVWDAGKNALEGFKIYRTLEFSYGNANTPDQVGQFISNWFKHSEPERGKNLRAALDQRGKERIKDLVKNPLRLALLCRTWQLWEGGLPDTKAVLYQQFVEAIYLWKDKEFSTTSDQRKLLNEKLGQLALQAIDRKDSRFRLLESFVRDLLGEPDEEGSLFWLVLRLGWLNQVGVAAENPGERVYAFFHPTFQEYFAALAVKDWHVFLNHTPHEPVQGTYHIFEPQWKEVMLLWLGRKDLPCQQKEDFIRTLIEFQDGCYSLYKFRALFLAAAGIAEFSDCSLAAKIMGRIAFFGFGYFRRETQEWTTFPSVAEEAKAALLETERDWAIKSLNYMLEHILITTSNKLNAWESAWYLRQIAPEDEAIDVILMWLLCIRSNKDYDEFINESLPQIGIGNSAAIASLILFLNICLERLRGETKTAPQFLYSFLPKNFGLISGQALICKNAIRFLAEIGTGTLKEIRVLIEILHTSSNPDIQQQVIKSLGKIAERNWNALHDTHLGTTDDLWETTKWETITPQWEAITALTNLLSTNHKDSIRLCAAQNLSKIDPGNLIVIPTFIDLMYYSQEEETRQAVIAYLYNVSVGNSYFIKPLTYLLLNSQNEKIRYNAASKLRQIDPDNPAVLPSLIDLTVTSQDEDTRRWATYELWRADPGNPAVLPSIIDLIRTNQKSSYLRLMLIKYPMRLGIFNNKNIEVINALSEILPSSQDDDLRWEAAYQLQNFNSANKQAITTMITLLCTTQDEKLCQQFINQLAEIGAENSEVRASLTDLLDSNQNEIVCWRSAATLGKINSSDKNAITMLTELLRTTEQENIRKAIIENLIEIDAEQPEILDALIHLLRTSQDRDTCEWATENLREICPASQFTSLVAALKDYVTEPTNENNFNRGILCEEILWHCAQNMPYPDFYRAWRGNDNIPIGDSSIAQTLEKQLPVSLNNCNPLQKPIPFSSTRKHSKERQTQARSHKNSATKFISLRFLMS
jgi:HEAT repeat protein/lambda repressor-like predicted transcriptional regulator